MDWLFISLRFRLQNFCCRLPFVFKVFEARIGDGLTEQNFMSVESENKKNENNISFRRQIFYPNVTTLRSGLCCRNSVCLTSVVCRLSVWNVGASYSGGWSFRQYFFTAVYDGHPLTFVQNFTEIVAGEPLRRER